MSTAREAFIAHLDRCYWCREEAPPYCDVGAKLYIRYRTERESAPEPSATHSVQPARATTEKSKTP